MHAYCICNTQGTMSSACNKQRDILPPTLQRHPYAVQKPSLALQSSSSDRPRPQVAPLPHLLQPLVMQVLQELRSLAGNVTQIKDEHAQLVQKMDGIQMTMEDQVRKSCIDKCNFQASNNC